MPTPLVIRIMEQLQNTLNRLHAAPQDLTISYPKKQPDEAIIINGAIKKIYVCSSLTDAMLLHAIAICHQEQRMLLTEYAGGLLAEKLVKNGIEFVDAAGNCFLKLPQHTYLIINQRKPVPTATAQPTGRAFSPTGLKLLFALLADDKVLQNNYRELQRRSGVSLGAIGYIIMDLKAQGFLLEADGGFKLVNRAKLIERWSEAYREKLRPKLHVRRFKTLINLNSQLQLLHGESTAWGGEAGAYLLDKYLLPETFSIYGWENLNRVIAKAKLTPAPDGNVEIINAFWPQPETPAMTVPPLLIYADLITSGDSRNLEAANRILQKYLAPKNAHLHA